MKNYNKDIMHWKEFPAYDMIWTDPPWCNGMVKFFQTQLKKDTGEIIEHTIEDIITQLAILSDKTKPVIIEYSEKGSDYVVKTMELNGHKFISKNVCMQSMGRAFVILVFNVEIDICKTEKGANIITETLIGLNYNTIFDPFAGVGFTAKAVLKAGKNYIGSELNPKRYSKLIKVNS